MSVRMYCGRSGSRFDLLPQLPHVDAKILRVGRLVPQFLEQELVGQHLSRMLHQQPQQIVFLRRELHVSVADFHDPPHQIDATDRRRWNTGRSPCACS